MAGRERSIIFLAKRTQNKLHYLLILAVKYADRILTLSRYSCVLISRLSLYNLSPSLLNNSLTNGVNHVLLPRGTFKQLTIILNRLLKNLMLYGSPLIPKNTYSDSLGSFSNSFLIAEKV